MKLTPVGKVTLFIVAFWLALIFLFVYSASAQLLTPPSTTFTRSILTNQDAAGVRRTLGMGLATNLTTNLLVADGTFSGDGSGLTNLVDAKTYGFVYATNVPTLQATRIFGTNTTNFTLTTATNATNFTLAQVAPLVSTNDWAATNATFDIALSANTADIATGSNALLATGTALTNRTTANEIALTNFALAQDTTTSNGVLAASAAALDSTNTLLRAWAGNSFLLGSGDNGINLTNLDGPANGLAVATNTVTPAQLASQSNTLGLALQSYVTINNGLANNLTVVGGSFSGDGFGLTNLNTMGSYADYTAWVSTNTVLQTQISTNRVNLTAVSNQLQSAGSNLTNYAQPLAANLTTLATNDAKNLTNINLSANGLASAVNLVIVSNNVVSLSNVVTSADVALTNYVNAVGGLLTNYSDTVAQNATTYADLQYGNATNYASTNGAAQDAALGANLTNYVQSGGTGYATTNYVNAQDGLYSTNATNFTLAIGLADTNFANGKQLGSANLTNWSGLATNSFYNTNANLQAGSVNLTNWSSLSTNAFYNTNRNLQAGSANLTNFSALTTNAFWPSGTLLQPATTNLTNWSALTTNSFYNVNANLQAGSVNLTNFSSLTTNAFWPAATALQPASANLTNWSSITTGSKEAQSANLDGWSAIATSSKEAQSAVLDSLATNNANTLTNLQGNFLGLATPAVDNNATNWVPNLSGGMYKVITATNDIYLTYCTNGPGAVSYVIYPNGANRVIGWPTNWNTLGTNALTSIAVQGTNYTITLTNGPRIGWVSIFSKDANPNSTNVVIRCATSL